MPDLERHRDAVLAALKAQPNLDVYLGGVVDAAGNPVKARLDPDGKAHMYAVLYYGLGLPAVRSERLSGQRPADDIRWIIDVAGGDPAARLPKALAKVRAALQDQPIGGQGLVRVTGIGPVLYDTTTTPARWVQRVAFAAGVSA